MCFVNETALVFVCVDVYFGVRMFVVKRKTDISVARMSVFLVGVLLGIRIFDAALPVRFGAGLVWACTGVRGGVTVGSCGCFGVKLTEPGELSWLGQRKS